MMQITNVFKQILWEQHKTYANNYVAKAMQNFVWIQHKNMTIITLLGS